MVKRQSPETTLLGRRLRAARLRAGIAQDRLGVMIGLDEGSSSARISRYETGVHEPPFKLVVQLANILGVSPAYFYCDDDQLAEIICTYSSLSNEKREALISHAANLVQISV